MTQIDKIIQYLKRRPTGATYGELTFATGATSVHKRLTEAERKGHQFEYASEWRQPKGERGAWVTRVWLVEANG